MEKPPAPLGLKVTGRLLGIAILLGAVWLGIRVTRLNYLNPRTNDAEVRANLIGIAPHVGGPFVELHVVDNQEVKAGDLLFVIDARPYEATLAGAQADLLLARSELQAMSNSVASAVAEVNVRTAQLTQATDDLKRYEPLLKDEAIDALTVDTARTAQRTAAAQLEAAQQALLRQQNLLGQYGTLNARISAAEAAVTAAQLNVNYCRVQAPFDGRVANLNLSVGQYAQPGQPIFALVDTRYWYVVANFRETYLQSIRPGLPVDVYLMAYPNRPVRGTVQGVGWAVQSQNAPLSGVLADVKPTLNWVRLAQRMPVRIQLEDPDPRWPYRMGMTAIVTIRGGQPEDSGPGSAPTP